MRRRLAFAIVVAACAAVAVAAIVGGARAGDGTARASAGARAALAAARARRRPVVVYRVDDARRRGADGQVAIAALANPNGRRTLTPLRCARVDVSAVGSGICLAPGSGFAAGYVADVFGADLRVRHTLEVEGIPSRARVSPDGRYGAVTLFVTGDSYADAGSFSTRTTIVDLASGRKVADLEDFVVMHGERRVTAVDVNFWGVTFARDSNRFYATMATGGKTYLIQGNVATRTAHTLRENVECPSLSPDGTRIAYKKLVELAPGTPRIWHLHVLDLGTMKDTALAEPDPIDDQAEWLGNHVVVYGSGEEVRAVRADGGGRPVTLLTSASSPAVVS